MVTSSFVFSPFLSLFTDTFPTAFATWTKEWIFNLIELQLKPMSKVSVIDITIHVFVYGTKLLAMLQVQMNAMHFSTKKKKRTTTDYCELW